MLIKVGKVCRGGGVTYIEVSVPHCSEVCDSITFSIQSEKGIDLPVEVYKSSATDSGYVGTFILATPMLNTRSVVVIAEWHDERGGVTRRARRRVSRFWIKWLSRLNYKLNYDEVSHLRDVDRFTYSNQIHVKDLYNSSIPDTESYLVKGIVCAPAAAQNIQLNLIGSDGTPNKSFKPYLGKPQHVDYEGISRVEIPFTARISGSHAACCLLGTASGEVRSGFLPFYRGELTPLFFNHIPHYYRMAELDRWNTFSRDRAKRYANADPTDYEIADGPLFSIIVPLYHTPIIFFREMIQSVCEQLYGNWELILVNSTPEDLDLRGELSRISDSRVKVVELKHNLGISNNTNAGINAATGDFIGFFDHDDMLDKLALFRYADAIQKQPSIDALYCDEDFLDESGMHISPHFKSDFNPDLLRTHNYITHFLVVRAEVAKELMLRSEFDGAQDYDFILRLMEKTHNIAHIPEVLYHWRISDTSTAKDASAKPYAERAGKKALEEHLARQGTPGEVAFTNNSNYFRVSYEVKGNPKVSIIIPNKDSAEVLKRCVDSICLKSTFQNFEVIIVENNSVEQKTFDFYSNLERNDQRVRVITWDGEFNYSKINNFGVTHASGSYLLLLNNDTEVISSNWLESMLGFCQREDVGAVGAKLLYPDDTIQHAGIAMITCNNVGEMGGPLHVFCHLDKDNPGYMNRAMYSQDVSMVTGACLMTRRSVYESLGGLSERYAVAFNDVDYCLRLREKNYLIVYDADAQLYHYESFSRGSDQIGERARRFVTEQGKLRTDWPDCFIMPDPYHGKYLTMMS